MAEPARTTLAEQTAVVILAAGKGTRMQDEGTAKVCFEIDGIAAINRTIATFVKKNFRKFCVVVGYQAQQVMETVAGVCPETLFVIQTPQLGTGHAAKLAAASLESIGHNGPILVTMGDKYIEPEAIDLLVDGFIRKQADLALLTVPKTPRTEGSGGRVLIDSKGGAVAIIEKADLARQQIADHLNNRILAKQKITGADLAKLIRTFIPDIKKQENAVPDLLKLSKSKGVISRSQLEKILSEPQYNLVYNGRRYLADQVEKTAKDLNPSLYLSKAGTFYYGVRLLDNNNAQNEYYLTDIVKHLACAQKQTPERYYKVVPIRTDKDTLIQGFNSPDELLAIQDYIRSQKQMGVSTRLSRKPELKKSQYAAVSEWLKRIETRSPRLQKWFNHIYGDHPDIHTRKIKQVKEVLHCYRKKFGSEQKVVIIRAPGRVNLMGRHIDHRGGCNNFLAIDKETILVAGIRDDDTVMAVNTKPHEFEDVTFNISELIGRFAWDEWNNFIDSDWVRSMLRNTTGNWGNYIKAAILRLQHQYSDLKIKGINIALTGDIPIAAGLSSSSSIVVASLQAGIVLNNLELEAKQFIDLCGQGEWFVGSRGGSGDHAAIYLGQRGKITNVDYLPFNVNKVVNAPKDYQVVIANSHIRATKSSKAKDTFNSKICCYNLGLELLKLRNPEISDKVEYIRDIDPEKLGCSVSDIYRLLKKIPLTLSRQEFRELLPSRFEKMISVNFATHQEQDNYDIRGVLLFGIAENLRSRLCVKMLEDADIRQFGRLMKISHNGDRVSTKMHDNKYQHFKIEYDDNCLNVLINDLASEDPEKVLNAQLYNQPGSYSCSTPEIDKMVDLASTVEGVAGAQIAGAGLGGCIMILAKKDAVSSLKKALNHYYLPRKLNPEILPCITVEGAGLIDF